MYFFKYGLEILFENPHDELLNLKHILSKQKSTKNLRLIVIMLTFVTLPVIEPELGYQEKYKPTQLKPQKIRKNIVIIIFLNE